MDKNGNDEKNKEKQIDEKTKKNDSNFQKKENTEGKFADKHLEQGGKRTENKSSNNDGANGPPAQILRHIIDSVLGENVPNNQRMEGKKIASDSYKIMSFQNMAQQGTSKQEPIIPPSTRVNSQNPSTCKYHIILILTIFQNNSKICEAKVLRIYSELFVSCEIYINLFCHLNKNYDHIRRFSFGLQTNLSFIGSP